MNVSKPALIASVFALFLGFFIPAYAQELCLPDQTTVSEEFKQKFQSLYNQDAEYAEAYDATLAQLDAAEAAVEVVMDRLNAEIKNLEEGIAQAKQLNSSESQIAELQAAYITKTNERQEIITYQCETLVPSRNKIRNLDELLN